MNCASGPSVDELQEMYLVAPTPELKAQLAAAELEEYEKQRRREMKYDNWDICYKIYRQFGYPTIHKDHRHSEKEIKQGRIRLWMINSDLMINNCHRVVPKELWSSP